MDLSVWLGQIFWWSVAMEGRPSRVTLPQLTEWVNELKLDMPSMPAPQGAHAFRAASSALTRKYVDGDGLAAELSVKEVSANNEFIVRHVIKTTTDPRTQRLGSEKVAQIKFYRPTRTSAGRRPGSEVAKPSLHPDLAGVDAEQVMGLLEDFASTYAVRSEFLSMAALRRVVRDFVVLHCDGLLVRSAGGLYFVENRWEGELNRLKTLFSRFGDEATCHMLPLIDDPYQRRLVSVGAAEHLVAECKSAIDMVSVESGLTAARKHLALKQVARARRLQKHYGDYLALDKGAWTRVDEAIADANAVMATLPPRGAPAVQSFGQAGKVRSAV